MPFFIKLLKRRKISYLDKRKIITYVIYEKVSDVPECRVWFASKNLTPYRMHLNDFLRGQIIAKCHSFPNMYDML